MSGKVTYQEVGPPLPESIIRGKSIRVFGVGEAVQR